MMNSIKAEDAEDAEDHDNNAGAPEDKDMTTVNGDPPHPRPLPQMAAQLRRESRIYMLQMLSCVACCILSVVLLIASAALPVRSGLPIGWMLGCLVSLMCAAALMPSARSRVLETWRDMPDSAMIGPLLNALGAASGETAGQIQMLLTTLLPNMGLGEAAALTVGQRRRLHNALLLGDADCYPAYMQAVVQALTQCADQQTLACLRQMAQRGAVTDRQQWVLDSIRKCLPDVEAQVAARQSGADLLRASSPAPDPAQLLRGAQSSPDPLPHTLLRPDASSE